MFSLSIELTENQFYCFLYACIYEYEEILYFPNDFTCFRITPPKSYMDVFCILQKDYSDFYIKRRKLFSLGSIFYSTMNHLQYFYR